MSYNRISFRTDTREVRALLTDVSFRNFVNLFNTEVLMLQGAGERTEDGMREYVFTMPDDERRGILVEFPNRADILSRIDVCLN